MKLNRREFQAAMAAAVAAGGIAMPNVGRGDPLPNILFIAIDDQNTYSSAARGYPVTKNGLPLDVTPAHRALADEGFACTAAISPVPYCAGAREAALRGLHPYRTGVYGYGQAWFTSKTIGPLVKGGRAQQKGIFEFFRDNGYRTIATGKVPHDGWKPGDGAKERYKAEPWAFDHYENCGAGDCIAPRRNGGEQFPSYSVGLPFDQRPDVIRTRWLIENVLQKSHDKPFFASIGLQDPHLPWSPPQDCWDALSPEQGVVIPYPMGVRIEDQRADLTLATSWDLKDESPGMVDFIRQYGERDSLGNNKLEGIISSGKWKEYIRAYLAEMMSSSLCVGMLRAATPANTIIVLWSDHGWMLGEKMGWRKFALWETAVGIPLVFAGPGISKGRCNNPISLVDLLPTLAGFVFGEVPTKRDLGKYDLDGVDRSSWLRGDPAAFHYSAVTTQWPLMGDSSGGPAWNPTNASMSVRDNYWHMIEPSKGGRSLYCHHGEHDDPNEWFNLLDRRRPEDIATAERLAGMLPDRSTFAPSAESGEVDTDE